MTTPPRPPARTGKRNGRPTKYNAQTVERILKCVEKGLPLNLAASAAGISHQSLASYRHDYPDFATAILEAIARGVEKRLAKIEAASDTGDWRASAWLLEHCQPEHFAKNRLEVSGPGGAPLMGAVCVYLPAKEDGNGGQPLTAVTVKELENGN